MDLYSFLNEIVITLFKHGWSLTTWGILGALFFRLNSVRRIILRRVPKRFRQEDKLDRIERKVDALSAHVGVPEWNGALKTSTSGQTSSRRSLRPSRMGIFRGSQLRRMKQMNKSINWVTLVVALLGAAKLVLQVFGIDVITDDMIDGASNVVAAVVTLVGVIMSHTKPKEEPIDASIRNSIERAE